MTAFPTIGPAPEAIKFLQEKTTVIKDVFLQLPDEARRVLASVSQ